MDEICLGYQLAIHYEQEELGAFCKRVICLLPTEEVLRTEGFLSCDWIVLMEIVKSNVKCREAVLLEACAMN